MTANPSKQVSRIIGIEESSRLIDRKVIRDHRSWMVDRIMGTGQVHILAGPSGSGKTSWILPFIKDWSEAKLIFNTYQSFPQPYIYLSCDRSMNELDQTLNRLGLRNWDIPCFSIEELETKWSLDHCQVTIEDLPNLFPWCKVFFIEAIGWFAPSGPKHSGYTDILRYWSRIRAIYEEHGLTIVGTTHAPKSKPEMKYANARDRIIGSVAQAGVASTIIVFDLEKETDVRDTGRIVTLLPRNEPNQVFRYTLDEHGRFEFSCKIDKEETEVAEYSLVKELEGLQVGHTLTKESIEGFVERAHCSPATMYRTLKNLVDDKYLEVVGVGFKGKKTYRVIKAIERISTQ